MSRQKFIDLVRNTEARADDDFHRYDVTTAAIAKLLDREGRGFLAIGLKGVGKSAAFKMLSGPAGADVVRAIDAETYRIPDESTPIPTRQYLREIRGEILFQAIADLVDADRADPGLSGRIPDDILQRARTLRARLWEKIKGIVGEVGGVSFFGFGITRRAAAKGKRKTIEQLNTEDHDEAVSILSALAEKVRFRTVIDDPEAIFTIGERFNANMVAAVCIAAHEIRQKLPNMHIVVLLKPNVFDALLQVDEFVRIPIDVRVRLSWSREELKEVVRRRAAAAGYDLGDFMSPTESILDEILLGSRTGPRDVLNRILVHDMIDPSGKMTGSSLAASAETFAQVSFEQMTGPYSSEYPGLARASIILFESGDSEFDREALRRRFDTMIASDREIIACADQEWARNSQRFADLLIQFGLVAIRQGRRVVVPYEADFQTLSKLPDVVFTYVPGMEPLIRPPRNEGDRRQPR